MTQQPFVIFRLMVLLTVGVLLVCLGCSGQPDVAGEASEGAAAQPAPEATAETAAAAEEPKTNSSAQTAKKETPQKSLMNPSSLSERAPDTFSVKFATSKGDFVVEVTRSWAPIGADRFYNLVKNGFFEEARFFRIVPNFIVQFGLPADPAVARVWQNATIKDDPVAQTNRTGSITFATAGPGTRTTQLFINLKSNTFLDGQGFSPFGRVTEGMDVVNGLYSGYGERPDQGQITARGNAYLKAQFPKLDYIKSTTIQ